MTDKWMSTAYHVTPGSPARVLIMGGSADEPASRVRRMNLTSDLWPCSRRVAHRAGHCEDPACPGVGAHPATMIGRK